MKRPAVSVVMSVRNGERYLSDAIESILVQSFTDFEFIILDNGSTDGTGKILERINDSRVTIVSQENIGLAASLNKGVSLGSGEFIARQDADDISHPLRLKHQIDFMRREADVGLLGTAASIWEEDVRTQRVLRHAEMDKELIYDILFNNPFVHTSVMFKRVLFEQVGGYTEDPLRQPPEDYELWSRMLRIAKGANLDAELVVYREVATSMSREGRNPFLEKLRLITAENLAYFDGGIVQPTHRNLAAYIHQDGGRLESVPDRREVLAMLDRVAIAIAASGRGQPSRNFSALRAQFKSPGPILRRFLSRVRGQFQ